MLKKCYLVSLGCSKNLVDSEVMLGLLSQEGFEVSQSPEEAGLLLVNTCGFIQPAVEEAIDEILALARIKEQHPPKKLVVTGCMVQRYGNKLREELPEVDLFVGTEGFHKIVDFLAQLDNYETSGSAIERPTYIMSCDTPRQLSTPGHRAFLKITEGCINKCSYCIIPSLRGKLRSRRPDDLILEARALQEAGVRELTLIGQDLTAYGQDFGKKGPRLETLLEALLQQCDISWIRLLYLFPSKTNEKLLKVMQQYSRILPYFDMPFQHVNDRLLKAMNRPYDKKTIIDLIQKIKEKLPFSAIRTTFMVGFPGETEKDFIELMDFVREAELDHVGVFAYSNEEGCRAYTYEDQIAEAVKERRRQRLMANQAEVSQKMNQKWVGQVLQVLIEGLSRESDLLIEGRTKLQAPDVDGCVYITEGKCSPGELVEVKITEAHTYDLVGKIVGSE